MMLSFKDVLKKTLESGGTELLGNSSRFQSYMLDMAEGKLPYIQQYLQVCTQDYLCYFYEASKCDSMQDILRCGNQAGEYLRSASFINEERCEEITGAFVEVICELKHIPYQGSIKAEENRKEEEKRRAEERKAAEEKRREEVRRQAEEKRQEEEKRAAEEKRREEVRRQAEEKKQENERRAAEQKKREEEKRAAEEKRREEERKAAEKKKKPLRDLLVILLVLGAVGGFYYYFRYVKSSDTTVSVSSTPSTFVAEVDEHLSAKEEKSLSFCKDIYNQYHAGWDQLAVNYETDSFEDIAAVLQSRGWQFFPDDSGNIENLSPDIPAFDGLLEGSRLMNVAYILSENRPKYCQLRLIENKSDGKRTLELYGGGDLGGILISIDPSSDETIESKQQAILTSLIEQQRQCLAGVVPPAVADILNTSSIRETGLTAKKEKKLLEIIEKHSKYHSVYLDDREWRIYASTTDYVGVDQPILSYFSISHQSKEITFSAYSDNLIHSFKIGL